MTDAEIKTAILSLCAARRPGKTICPSEAARALAPDWRQLMPEVRRVAAVLAAEGRLAILERGAPVDPETAKGLIRLALARGGDSLVDLPRNPQ